MSTTQKTDPDSALALTFFASCNHSIGNNGVQGEVRKIHGIFFHQGHARVRKRINSLAVLRSTVQVVSEKMLSLLGCKKPSTALGIGDNEDASEDLEGVLEKASQ